MESIKQVQGAIQMETGIGWLIIEDLLSEGNSCEARSVLSL